MMTRGDFQRICGMMKTTAMGYIRHLRGEGKLKIVDYRLVRYMH
nr:hypothetical protein [Bacteroides intestinalis]